MRVQSLLFRRDEGWTEASAKAWAKSHDYSNGKVDVTDQYVRIRQFDPKGAKTLRTVPFGRGIRAVVAREAREGRTMATTRTVNASRRSKKKGGKRRGKRRAKRAAPAAPPKRKRRRKARKAAPVAEAPKRRRKRRKVRAVAEAPKRRRKKSRRRAKRKVHEAWRGNPAGHAKAAKKGWKRRKKSGRKGQRRAKRAHEAPRRRRRSSMVMESPRRRRRGGGRRRSRGVFEASASGSMSIGMLVLGGVSGGVGFVLADGLDRFLATYNPSAEGDKPKNKFTSDGAGTAANALNVASRPGLVRLGASVGMTALPAVGAVFVKNKAAKTALTMAAFGAGISAFRTLWSTVLMPLFRPKETAELPKSLIARLYPSEVAAAINLAKKNPDGTERTPQMAVSTGGGAGALSGPSDVGPFALSGDSPYPDAAQAIRHNAGVHGPGGDYPTVQNAWGTGDYPTAQQAAYAKTGMVGDGDGTVGSIFDQITKAARGAGLSPHHAVATASHVMATPHDVQGALRRAGLPAQHIAAIAPHIHKHAQRLHGIYIPTGVSGYQDTGVAADPSGGVPYQPGPPPGSGPGPKMDPNKDCGCVGDPTSRFAAFLGDAEDTQQ